MYGLMGGNIRANGSIIRCMVKVVMSGEMEENTKDSINMTKNME